MNLGIEFEAITMTCGHVTALPRCTATQRRRSHKSFYGSTCGESNYVPGKSDIEKEREKTARARDAASQADYRARALKGVVTKQRKRSVAGACPCCNRTFQQLARHMKSKHPDYEEKE